jgi:hypothetical protein
VLPEIDDHSSSIGRSWKTAFGVKSREEAEKVMEE